MKEKYVKASSVYDILHQLSIEASNQWDMDGTIMCGRIRKELDMLSEGSYVELSPEEENELRHVQLEDAMQA